MVDGRDGDALVLWFFDSEVLGFLVCWFLFGWIRAEGFPGVYVGLLGFFFSFFSGMQGFSLLFSPFLWVLWFFLFSFLFWGLRGSEPWGWLWTRFPWLRAHWDFRYIMIWHTIFFLVYYGLGDGAT